MKKKFQLGLRDKKLLFELDKNSRASLTDLAKKLKTSKEVIHYRLNNLVKNNVILRFQTVTSLYRFGLTAYKVYLRLQNITDEKYHELVEYLNEKESVFSIGTTRGHWNLIFGIWAKNMEEFFDFQDKILEKFSKYIQEKELSISRENLQFNRRWMYDDSSKLIEFNFGEKDEKITLNGKDKKILDALIPNSRKNIVKIANETKLSVDIVRYRIKQMEKDKIIIGYKCQLNPKKLNFVTSKAFIFFKNINKKRKEEFFDECKKIKNLVNIVITFAPWDLEIMFETKDYEKHYEIMDNLRDKFQDIISHYDSALITSEPKQIFKAE